MLTYIDYPYKQTVYKLNPIGSYEKKNLKENWSTENVTTEMITNDSQRMLGNHLEVIY